MLYKKYHILSLKVSLNIHKFLFTADLFFTIKEHCLLFLLTVHIIGTVLVVKKNLGTSIAITPLGTQEDSSDTRGEEVFDWVISSDLLPLNDPDTPTLLNRSSGSHSSPDISFDPSSLAPGRCFRTWVLTIFQFFYPSLSLIPIAPTSVPLPSIFRKLAGMALPPTLTLTVLQQRYTRLFPLLLSLPLWH